MVLRLTLKNIYILFCEIYSFTFSILNLVLLKEKKSLTLKKGYFKYHDNINIFEIIRELNLQSIEEKYQKVSIIKKESLKKLLNFIFTNEFKQYLLKTTGYRYSIDYLFIYENKFIPDHLSNKSIYANKPHYDKPFTKNMLKLIIPIGLSSIKKGPLIISDNYQSFNENNLQENSIAFLSPKTGTYIYGFNPRETSHFAQPPEEKLSSMHIMFQLNPAKKWSLNKKIIERQLKIEPNFPELRKFFSLNTHLKLSNEIF